MPPLKEFVEKQVKNFQINWGIAPEGSLKYEKGKEIESYIIETAHSAYLLGITEAEKEIKDYWKFDENQHPISSWHDKQDLLSSLQKLKESATQTNEVILAPKSFLTGNPDDTELVRQVHIFSKDNNQK